MNRYRTFQYRIFDQCRILGRYRSLSKTTVEGRTKKHGPISVTNLSKGAYSKFTILFKLLLSRKFTFEDDLT